MKDIFDEESISDHYENEEDVGYEVLEIEDDSIQHISKEIVTRYNL